MVLGVHGKDKFIRCYRIANARLSTERDRGFARPHPLLPPGLCCNKGRVQMQMYCVYNCPTYRLPRRLYGYSGSLPKSPGMMEDDESSSPKS